MSAIGRQVRRYCEMCDVWVGTRHTACPQCGATTGRAADEGVPARSRPLTRHERLQAAVDAGIDTWDEYRGER